MKIFFSGLSAVLVFLVLLSGNPVWAFDFIKVKQDLKSAVENNPAELKLADTGHFSALPAGRVLIKNARYFLSPGNPDLLFITGRGALPADFKGLSNNDTEIVLSVSADSASSRESKDMLVSLTGIFDGSGIGDFYKDMDDCILKEMIPSRSFVTHSNAKQTLTAEMFPPELAAKFSPALGKNFALSLKDGLTLTAPINFNFKNTSSKPVSDFAKLMGIDKISLTSSLFLSPDWKHITVKVLLGDGFKIGFLPDFMGSSVPYLFVNLSEFGFGFETTLKLPPENNVLKGVCQMSVPIYKGKSANVEPQTAKSEDPIVSSIFSAGQVAGQAFAVQSVNPVKKDSAVLLGNVGGIWENVLGFKGFNIYDLVLKGEIPLLSPGLVIGIGGRVDIGSVKVAVGAKLPIGYNLANAAFQGKVSLLPFGEIVAMLVNSSGEKKEKSEIPLEKLALKDVILSIAAKDDRDLNIKEGLAFAGTLIFDEQDLGIADVRTTHPEQTGLLRPFVGFRATGWIKEIAFGPVKLTGNGPDNKKGTKDDGLFLDLAYGTKISDYLKFSGLVKLFGTEDEAQAEITCDSINVFTRRKMFELYEAQLTLKGSVNLKKPEFLVKGALTENFADDAVKYTTEFFNDAIEELTDDLEDATEDFENASEAVNDARKDAARGLDEFKKDVEKFAEKIE
ncbi:MAG: hypothetical protein AB1403_20490, partial [Candidatus Riflebacteria bacterium]